MFRKQRPIFLIIFVSAVLRFTSSVSADTLTLLWQKPIGFNIAGTQTGFSVAILGDLNGDGYAEFADGSPYNDLGDDKIGHVQIWGGKLGNSIDYLAYLDSGDQFGYSIATIGDINGDTVPDFIVGAPGADTGALEDIGKVWVFSGKAPITPIGQIASPDTNSIGFGKAVAGCGDVNGDGTPDFIVGAPDYGLGGRAFVYSGVPFNHTILYTKTGAIGGFGTIYLGYSVGGVGDLNGDGKAEFAVGAPNDCENVPFLGCIIHKGHIYIYSGATGGLLYRLGGHSTSSTALGTYFGWSLASVGDINNDGKNEIIGGAIHADGLQITSGTAEILSGADTSQICMIYGAGTNDFFGSAVAGVGDIDGDTVPDFAVGAYGSPPGGTQEGSVYIYSGKSCSLLFEIDGNDTLEWLGYAIGSGGDVNNDGRWDIIIGAPKSDPNGITDGGSILVYANVLNSAPLWDNIGNKTVSEEGNLSFRVHATDPNGDSLILHGENLPSNASFYDSGNGAGSFVFNPDTTQAGVYNVDFIASDGAKADTETVEITVTATACSAKPGDANASGGAPNLTDIIYLVNYVFKAAPAPSPLCRGDANASGGASNLIDIIYLVNYVFKSGPAPVKSGVCCL